jgi:serine/threonine protein phosphatase 1
MKHYVIGDVHGNYDTLMKLINLLPCDAKVIFVGDLIDRGAKSAQVVRFVRENNHLCVMGNHEEMMAVHGSLIANAYKTGEALPNHSMWYSNGGVSTLQSYGLIKLKEGKPVKVDEYEKALEQFKGDIRWMEKLPLYLELPITHPTGKPVVISHAPIAVAWAMRTVDSMYSTFARLTTTNRRDPDMSDAKIFNIFGHTPMQNGPRVEEHFVNVDTGCYKVESGYNQLTAYCIETGEYISVKSV